MIPRLGMHLIESIYGGPDKKLVATHSTPWLPLGFGPMKPLFMIQTNEDVDKHLELYDVKLIEDEIEII